MNSHWTKLFTEKRDIYQPNRENFRRHVLFKVDRDDSSKIIAFGTDPCWHRGTVLLHSDVMNIKKGISKVHLIHDITIPKTHDLIDTISHELLNDSYIASDGITYSYSSLWKLFDIYNNPVSPLTREPLLKINAQLGIKNIFVSVMITNFIEELNVDIC